MSKQWCVYIATNYTNSVFYTGITNDIQRRVWEHRQNYDKKSFTSRYRIYKLVWCEAFSDPTQAITVEKKVKDFRREKKLALIKRFNPLLKDLSTLR